MEVIVTGRITTYPGPLAVPDHHRDHGPGGRRRAAGAAGAAEGQAGRPRACSRPPASARCPSMPAVIGVITSPTGAVIRDILHRIRERWPCRVIVWPVGDAGRRRRRPRSPPPSPGSTPCQPGGPIPRPDVLIVARGGGSVEDLWPFNDEALARAAAASAIPLISAVGHETDTTLIDFVADRRAPTPTAAAEMATPVFAELAATPGRLRAAPDHLRRADHRAAPHAAGGRGARACRARRSCWRSPPSGSTSPPDS